MKGFKHTGRGPKSGHSFSSKAGFTGSTGRRQEVRTYSRSVPKRKFADGGMVQVADSGSSVVRRTRPVTEFDAEHGGKSPLRPGFADGGRVGSVGAAIKMVKALMARGESAESAAKKAASRYGVPQADVVQAKPASGGGGLPAEKQMLAKGGMARAMAGALGKVTGRQPMGGRSPLSGALGSAVRNVVGRAAPPVRMAPGLQAPAGGKVLRRVAPPPGKAPAATPPRAVGVTAPRRANHGYGAFGRNPLIRG